MKKSKMEIFLVALIAIVFFVFVVCIFGRIEESDKQTIQAALFSRGLSLVEHERRLIDIGPFYFVSKGERVYRVTEQDKSGRTQVEWVRFGFFGTEWVQEE